MGQATAGGTITVVVPYPPGGVSDMLARGVAPAFADAVGRPVVLENITGASGSIGAARMLQGTALRVAHPGGFGDRDGARAADHAVAEVPGHRFQAARTGLQRPIAVYARPDLDARTVDELAALAARRGTRPLNYGSPGTGSLHHLAIKALHVAYRGGSPLLQDLMAGVKSTLARRPRHVRRR